MEHTEDELRIMDEYEQAVDPEVLSFVKAIHDGEERLNYVTVAFLSDKAAQRIEELTGMYLVTEWFWISALCIILKTDMAKMVNRISQ